jgi:lipopolysaccharide export system ATP-binding protein
VNREVLDTCDHSYVLHDGVMITEGDKEQILNNTKVREVYLGQRD